MFRVKLTPVQEQKVGRILAKWDKKNYNLLLQNCVALVKEVAAALHLNVPFIPMDITSDTPGVFIDLLKAANTADTPLAAPGGAAQHQAPATLPVIRPGESVDAAKRAIEEQQRILNQIRIPLTAQPTPAINPPKNYDIPLPPSNISVPPPKPPMSNQPPTSIPGRP